MRTPLAVLKFVARAALSAVGAGVVGDFALEVLPDVARDVWQWWGRGHREEELRAEVQAIAALPDDEIHRLAELAAAEEAAAKPQEIRALLTAYLAAVPAAIRRSQRRPADPSGRTVSSALRLTGPEHVLPLLPSRLPHFRPGDRPPGVGDWELVELLGMGGFGEVWKALNPLLGEPVALKFCLDAEAARVLRNEAALLGRVMGQGHHPGIVRLLHTYLSAPTPCLEYEFVAGGDLAGLIRHWQHVPQEVPGQAARLLRDLAEGVGFAHRLNPPIVHRDLKPANILLQHESSGRTTPRVADFGIGGIAAGTALRQPRDAAPGLFLTTAVRGSCTPLYSSPQQLRGDDPRPSDDVYSLGVIWYQMLTGDPAAAPGPDWQEELASRNVPDTSLRLLGSCVASKPERRPVDASDLAERLTGILTPPRPTPVPDSVPTLEEVLDVIPVATPIARVKHRVRLALEEGRLVTDVDRDTVFSALRRALEQSGVSNVMADRESGTIQGSTSMSMINYGHIVRASVRVERGATIVEVQSKPRPPQIVDWGRGKREVRAILETLAQQLEGVRAGGRV
jgi:eukaryotic-like serine/threonine-protein kinase